MNKEYTVLDIEKEGISLKEHLEWTKKLAQLVNQTIELEETEKEGKK